MIISRWKKASKTQKTSRDPLKDRALNRKKRTSLQTNCQIKTYRFPPLSRWSHAWAWTRTSIRRSWGWMSWLILRASPPTASPSNPCRAHPISWQRLCRTRGISSSQWRISRRSRRLSRSKRMIYWILSRLALELTCSRDFKWRRSQTTASSTSKVWLLQVAPLRKWLSKQWMSCWKRSSRTSRIKMEALVYFRPNTLLTADTVSTSIRN